jgi:peptide/nickel transport system substrate-binding protein
MRPRPIAALAAICLVTALACGKRQKGLEPVPDLPPEQDKPAHGDVLRSATIGDASNLIPMLASDSASHSIAGLIYNALLSYDGHYNLYGVLAERWEVSEDGLALTFRLREGVEWQDGEPFTAEDVLFTYRLITHPETPTPYSESYKQVKKAEILDAHTIRFTYQEPYCPALESWASLDILPRHLLEGSDITKSPLSRRPVGTGPYRFKEWKEQERIELSANHDFFMGHPWIERSVTRVIPDTATQFLQLKSGGIDQMGLTPTQWTRQTNNEAFGGAFNKFKYPVNSFVYLGFNLLDPRFADRRVRQAIAYAIDREEIVKGVLLGLGVPGVSPYVPTTKWFNADLAPYPYDPEKARRLLAEAGWADSDGDGLLDKNGKPFKFEIITNHGNAERKKTAVIIQQRVKAIGIDISIRTLEWAAFINDFIDEKKFEAVILGWSIGLDPDQYDIWHSSKTTKKELNFISYSNSEVDKLLEQGRRRCEEGERKRIYDRLQEIIYDDQALVFLYVPYALVTVHKRFHGIEVMPGGIGDRWWNRWYVPKPIQRHAVAP